MPNQALRVSKRLVKRANAHGEDSIFAAESIRRKAVVIPLWHEGFYANMPGWVHLTIPEILALPEHQRELFFRYGTDEDFDLIAGPLTIESVTTLDNFINHSCEPNLGYDEHGNIVAREDIAAGAELFVDYGCFTVNFDETFMCRCGAATCRRRVTRDDWKTLALRHGYKMPRFLHPHIGLLLSDRKNQ